MGIISTGTADSIFVLVCEREPITTISESCTPSSKTTSMTDLSPMVISWLINPV